MTAAAVRFTRIDGRLVRVGDVVRVKPSRPYKRDGYHGTVRAIRLNAAVEIDVAAIDSTRARDNYRTLDPDRIEPMRQPKETVMAQQDPFDINVTLVGEHPDGEHLSDAELVIAALQLLAGEDGPMKGDRRPITDLSERMRAADLAAMVGAAFHTDTVVTAKLQGPPS